MFKRFAILGLATGLLALAPRPAQALPLITGALSISGSWVPVNASTGTSVSTIGAATGVDFINSGNTPTPGVAGLFSVNNSTGSLATIAPCFMCGAIKDLSLSGATVGGYLMAPVTAFQIIDGGFSFDLLTLSITQQITNQLDLAGTGLLHLAGFEDTFGTFIFSGQGSNGSFSFSATDAVPAAVPEPGSMVLLGTGLLGLGASIRRRLFGSV